MCFVCVCVCVRARCVYVLFVVCLMRACVCVFVCVQCACFVRLCLVCMMCLLVCCRDFIVLMENKQTFLVSIYNLFSCICVLFILYLYSFRD